MPDASASLNSVLVRLELGVRDGLELNDGGRRAAVLLHLSGHGLGAGGQSCTDVAGFLIIAETQACETE